MISGAKARAVMHGAISIVNALATGKGSALGISLKVVAEVEVTQGRGVNFAQGNNRNRLINNIVQNTMPIEIIEANLITIKVSSEIPIGYGLKSSSAVSNAVALACSKLAKRDDVNDYKILEAAVRSSLDAKVSFTGAYDDATACYFGGFTVTDNTSRTLIRTERAPEGLNAVIFLPRNIARGDVRKLNNLSDIFMDAFGLAEAGQYWKAMKLNGVLASAALSSRYAPAMAALENGAISASMSGNGPSIAAVAYENNVEAIKLALSKFDGQIIISKVNNQKANVDIIDG
ncbi:MAG: shikimate kinase [Thermoproteota archaeon]|jgi:shikimate kinase|nr:shikimate kinase [Thermoproteota archaeon]